MEETRDREIRFFIRNLNKKKKKIRFERIKKYATKKNRLASENKIKKKKKIGSILTS